MAKKIAVANIKGGIGKTSTAISLADGIRLKNKKVLLIDADPNSLSSTMVYRAKTEDTYTLSDILYDGISAEKAIQNTEYGDIIPIDDQLTLADTKIPADADRFYHLKDASEKLEEMYDYIIIDCPPGNGVILGNVLSYTDHIIIPITCDSFGIQCLDGFKDIIDTYKKRINKDLNTLGILITMYEKKQSLTRDLEEKAIPKEVSYLNTKLFKTRIRRSVRLKESQLAGIPIYKYAKNSTVSNDYMDFTNEVLRKIR